MNKSELLKLLNQEENEIINNDIPHERVLLIDGLNLFFRNFAMMNFVNSQGIHIGGLGGFIRSLNFLVNHIQPTSVYVVFDGVGSSVNRKNILPEYKSGRNQTRITNWDVFEDLEEEHDSKINQIVRLIHYLKCLPIKILSINKVEADDVISYLADILSKKYDSQVVVVSNDQDFVQIVTDKVKLFKPTEKEYYDPSTVKQKYGILVENFIIYKTLLGDNSDKIEGIKGLGKKGILKKFPELAERYVSFDDLMNICESKYKEHIIYSKILFDKERLKNNFKIMNLGKPLIDDSDKQYMDTEILNPTPQLNISDFISLYNEDELGKIMKNPEYTINNTFKILK
jgi:5'-3' exonuclease